jgi:photosystem II stability/assembly factor-like uncharacterized protein
MTQPRIHRRAVLALGLAGTCTAIAAPYQADGPARMRPLAAKGSLLDLVLAGPRLVAVGERGHVLLSDDQGKTWRQAKAVPTRSTLTSVCVTDANTLWAAGHGAVILKSADAGESWTLVDGKAEGPEVLLDIRVQADGHGLAVGGFGAARITADGGKTWAAHTLLEGEEGERHLNHIVVSDTGTWLIAAEGGHVLRGTGKGGLTAMDWKAIKTPYAGSLWTGTPLGGGTLLLGGMRGNLVRSGDDGSTWTHQPVPKAGSLTGCVMLSDGRPLLVGVDGTVLVGDAAGNSFTLQQLEDRATLTAVAQLGNGTLMAAGTGLRSLELPK